ncbi:hypothetical protein BJ742DRAFT_37566 [Cladochytrium replicatum]|nr:hypothetical protein BJ742DRAFT_37566 [Cladochytrium replicatum]
MGIDLAAKACERTSRQCKELLGFIKLVNGAHAQFSRSLMDACSLYMKSELYTESGSDEYGTLWNFVSRVVEDLHAYGETHRNHTLALQRQAIEPFQHSATANEASRKEIFEKVDKLTKSLQETYTTVKKSKADYDMFHAQAVEATEAIANAQIGSAKKEFERLQSKAQIALDKATSASEHLRECEIVRNKAQEEYYTKALPDIYKEVATTEENLLQSVFQAVQIAKELQKAMVTSQLIGTDDIQLNMSDVDIAADMKRFSFNFTSDDNKQVVDISVRSLLNPLKAARMQVKRDHSTRWTSHYFVLMDEPRKLFCFDSEDSEKAREIISLNDCKAYSMDDSYFGKPHCIQLIITPATEYKSDKVAAESRKETSPSEREKQLNGSYSYHNHGMLSVASSSVGRSAEAAILSQTPLFSGSHEESSNFVFKLGLSSSHSGLLLHEASKNKVSVVYLLAESAVEKADWLHHLHQTCYCCNTCSATYGYRLPLKMNVNKGRQDVANDPSFVRQTKRLHLWIMEAKDLQACQNSKSSLAGGPLYCEVLLDDIRQAKTSSKSLESLFWGEDFKFYDFSPCHSRLRILLYQGQHGRPQKDTEVGYVSIPLQSMQAGKRTEGWFQVRSFGSSEDEDVVVGVIRLALTLTSEHYIPKDLRERFLKILIEPSLICVKSIGKVITNQREEFARGLMNILMAYNQDVTGISEIMRHEVEFTENPNIIFRGSTVATKILDQYMKSLAAKYLRTVLRPIIKQIYSSKDSCEVDPSRYPQLRSAEYVKDSIRRHWKRLLGHVGAVWDAINRSVDSCPKELIEIFASIRSAVQSRFPEDKNTVYCAISGFIFLRFFCPAILSPKLFELMPEHPDSITARTLTLVAKILQNLANMTIFEGKEPYMEPCNVFLEQKRSSMMEFLDHISSLESCSSLPSSPKNIIDINHNTWLLHASFRDLQSVLQTMPCANDPVVKELFPLIDELNDFKVAFSKVQSDAEIPDSQTFSDQAPYRLEGQGKVTESQRYLYEVASSPVTKYMQSDPTAAAESSSQLSPKDQKMANTKRSRNLLSKKGPLRDNISGSQLIQEPSLVNSSTGLAASTQNMSDSTTTTADGNYSYSDDQPSKLAYGSYFGAQFLGTYIANNPIQTSFASSFSGGNLLSLVSKSDEQNVNQIKTEVSNSAEDNTTESAHGRAQQQLSDENIRTREQQHQQTLLGVEHPPVSQSKGKKFFKSLMPKKKGKSSTSAGNLLDDRNHEQQLISLDKPKHHGHNMFHSHGSKRLSDNPREKQLVSLKGNSEGQLTEELSPISKMSTSMPAFSSFL